MVKVFIGSFNINGCQPRQEDCEIWFQEANRNNPEIVAIGFQECDSQSFQNTPTPLNFQQKYEANNFSDSEPFRENEGKSRLLLDTVHRALPTGHKLVADVAIGEPPSDVQVIEGVKTQWYGSIRLLVYVKEDFDPDPQVFTAIAPVGDKKSQMLNWEGYAENESPDKGAVAVCLPKYNLLLVNCHLFGTNKYGVCESTFDTHRIRQLDNIFHILQMNFPKIQETRIVAFGDLNFRVQMFCEADQKQKAGLDFFTVKEIAESGDPQRLRGLFQRYDRLHLLLTHSDTGMTPLDPCAGPISSYLPKMFQLIHDAHDVMLSRSDTMFLPPTFTKKSGAPFPRSFGSKRTPSWCDRVLWEGLASELLHLNTCLEVTVSDHDPITALFDFDCAWSKPKSEDFDLRLGIPQDVPPLLGISRDASWKRKAVDLSVSPMPPHKSSVVEAYREDSDLELNCFESPKPGPRTLSDTVFTMVQALCGGSASHEEV